MAEAALAQRTSAYDRSKEYDVCLLTCGEPHCHETHSRSVESICTKNKFKLTKFSVEDVSCIPTAIVTQILVCKHNKDMIKQCQKELHTTGTVVLEEEIETKTSMEKFAQQIQEKVLEGQVYDSGTVGNDYTEGIVDGRCPSEIQRTTSAEAAGQSTPQDSLSCHFKGDFSPDLKSPPCIAELKYHSSSASFSHEYGYTKEVTKDDNSTYTSLIDSDTDIFLDPKALSSSSSHTGSFVSQEYILPKENYDDLEDKSPNAIVRMYNNDECRDSVDFRKYIDVRVTKKCVDCKNFHGLVILLKCDNISIQRNVLQKIEKFLYSTEVRLCNTNNLLLGIYGLLEVVELWAGNQELVLLLLNSLLTTLVILFMASNVRGDSSIKDSILIACRNTVEKIDKVEKLHTSDDILKSACQHLRYSAIRFFEFSQSEKVSVLRMGNWSDAMKNVNNRKKITQEFPKMSEIEQSAVLFSLLNLEILQPGNSSASLEVLHTCLKTTLSQTSKKKDNVSLFPLLQLSTKMIYMIMEKSNCHVERCLDLFTLYLDNGKVHQAVRVILLKEIGSLLFHIDKRIMNKMFYFLSKNKLHSHDDLRQITVSHVEKSLGPLNISIDCDSWTPPRNSLLPPYWSKFEGTVDDKTVNVHILLPSKSCIMEGVMEDYRKRPQDGGSLKEHEQQRDMLYLLCRKGSTSHVMPLVGFQVRPLPPFYVTLQSRDSVPLTEYLLLKRKTKDWIPDEKLCTLAADILSGVAFLHHRGIVHRGLTAACFSINDNGQVYLSSLATATEGHHFEFVAECRRMPLRWSAPESILYDKFSCWSDAYMTGQTLYELFTHGCHPFTELYGYDLDDMLQLIVFQNLKPRQWPCIPKAIHEIILQFIESDPQRRNSLGNGLERLNNFLLTMPPQRAALKRPRHCHREDLKYPRLDQVQPNEPETELPEVIRRLKNQNGKIDPVIGYTNLRKTQRKQHTILAISEADITSYDVPMIVVQDSKLKVQESVSPKFYETTFTELSKSFLQNILNVLKWPPAVEKKQQDFVMHSTCYHGESLSQLSLRRCYGDPDDQRNTASYCRIVHETVQFVSCLHESDWILRDICCQNLHYNDETQKVFPIRLGRMVYISSGDVLDDSIIEEVFPDRKNWSPIETLQYGQFSKEGDIYMLAMTIYEFFMGLEINIDNPTASSIKCAPFCRVPKKELIKHVLSGEVPQQPMYCPDNLYDVMVKCWNRDRTQRPTCEEILEVTRMLLAENDVECLSVEEEYAMIPDLPPRSHATPASIHPLDSLERLQKVNQHKTKVNPLYSFDRGDSKRSNVKRCSKNWSLRRQQEEVCEEHWNSDNSSLTSGSILSFANSSSTGSDSTISIANSSASDSEESYDDCISTTKEMLDSVRREREHKELIRLHDNTADQNGEEPEDLYTVITGEGQGLEGEEQNPEVPALCLNTTRFPDNKSSVYQDFDDNYLTATVSD